MGASVVRRHDLDVERVIASIDVVLHARVGELDVPLGVARQLVLSRPLLDLEYRPIRLSIRIVSVSIAGLQELLILAFQVVLEDDAVDVRAFVTEVFGFLRVGAIEFRVMLQFARLRDAGIESLAVARVIVQTPRFQQIAPLFCQRDDGVVAVEADRLNQPESRRCQSSP